MRDLTTIVVDENGGEASGIWKNRPAAEVNRTFRRVHGVGDGIANMMVLLIEKAYGVRFGDLDRRSMDIKPDVHTMRVLFRTGAAGEEAADAAKAAARYLSPEYPGAIDGSLWRIGQQWCRPTHPDCGNCPLEDLCPKVGVGAVN
jgi:endonuclease III